MRRVNSFFTNALKSVNSIWELRTDVLRGFLEKPPPCPPPPLPHVLFSASSFTWPLLIQLPATSLTPPQDGLIIVGGSLIDFSGGPQYRVRIRILRRSYSTNGICVTRHGTLVAYGILSLIYSKHFFYFTLPTICTEFMFVRIKKPHKMKNLEKRRHFWDFKKSLLKNLHF